MNTQPTTTPMHATAQASVAASLLKARNTREGEPGQENLPWWRVPMVWVVLSGPLSVVVASLVTAVVAWRHIDPVLSDARPGHAQPADEVPVPADPKNSLAPAMKARNHAATPRP